MLISILKALAAIPILLEHLKLLGELVKQAQLEKWLADSEEHFSALKKAKTPEEKLDAAKNLQQLIARL